MKKGMLWQVEEGRPLSEEINRAAEYYRKKYGRKADTVEMHPSTMDEITRPELVKLTLCSSAAIMPGTLWIGAEVE